MPGCTHPPQHSKGTLDSCCKSEKPQDLVKSVGKEESPQPNQEVCSEASPCSPWSQPASSQGGGAGIACSPAGRARKAEKVRLREGK